MKKLIECVPNFSEGRDTNKIEKIVDNFRGKKDLKLLDYQWDEDHNRSVVTVVGEPNALKEAVINAVGTAQELIDMTSHEGQHPRMGATDVIPFIPVKNTTVEECIELSKEVGKELWEKYQIPVFLYEKSASAAHRKNLSKIRKGQYEGMEEKIQEEKWRPDFGDTFNKKSGVTAVGARSPLVAFNVNLDTDNIDIANKISKQVRHISGGFRYCKAMGVELKDRGIVQVSMNMTDYTKTALYQTFEAIKMEAKRWGVNVVGSEIVGLVPMMALVNTAEYYLGIEDFQPEQILESHLME
ncbi:glutamate formimidoyltransferase [Geotoga petraea]|jgi:glutamate formiminotransferase|uniref:glutamate formimidoyltransferase n=1 Tax=Geotoga petraea TaxID=28234 RepID=A0A1G6L6X8_9BACT|nr:glutamate formimidoyltransferase [Geotoga petraea]TGG88859.1 glutamate formimidoyltransferase [Geotoga petraea]SDC39010.1 glutamate formiminotransferase [Geotoga petraea]